MVLGILGTIFNLIKMEKEKKLETILEQLKEYEKLLDLDGEDEISEDLTLKINATLEELNGEILTAQQEDLRTLKISFINKSKNINYMDVTKFWQIFSLVFFFIVWFGSILNIKPFVVLFKIFKWCLIIIFGVLFLNYAKKEFKTWIKED